MKAVSWVLNIISNTYIYNTLSKTKRTNVEIQELSNITNLDFIKAVSFEYLLV
jgi:hypothetical protein